MRRSWMMNLGCWCCLAATASSLPAAASTSSDLDSIGTRVQQEQWREGLALLGTGQIDKAADLIHRLVANGVTHESVRRVDAWLADFAQQQAERTDRIRADYEKYVGWVQEETDKGLWRQAAWSCGLAFNNAHDPDAFRTEPWLVKATEGAAQAALEYEEQDEWYKAASIYVRLSETFPHNKEYRQALSRCQDHIRVELIYEPESDWKAAVSDINPEMARAGFAKIDTDYLKKPAFKDAAIGGLKQLLLLANKPKLANVFPGLNDEFTVGEFRIRISENLEQIERKDKLTVDEFINDEDNLYDKVLEINREVRLFPEAVLIHEFVYGALQPLDKFSDVIWPAEVAEFNKHTQGKFYGVGIQIRKQTSEPILVVSPLRDSPAYAAGIRPGDLITRINGRLARKYSITRAVREITGPEGTTVTLTIRRPGRDKEFDVKLERQEIIIHTIKGFERDEQGDWKFMVDPAGKIGYVRVTNFTEGTCDELQEVLEGLTKRGQMRGLIFDLRDNPGGPLKSAVEACDLFLDAGRLIVSTRDRDGKPWEVSSSTEAGFTDFPMIVLVSRYSASASEIVAGALQVHHRAVIVGERTYGKGSVQGVLPLDRSRRAFLKLTTALYYLPNGRCLHKDEDSTTWGVDPDLEARLVPKERIKLNELQLRKDILKGKNQTRLTEEELKSVTDYRTSTGPAGGEQAPDGGQGLIIDRPSRDEDGEDGKGDEEDEEELEITRTDPNEYPEADPQLEEALLLMRVWLETDQPWPAGPAEVAVVPTAAGGG